MNRRSFLKSAAVGAAAAVPFTAFIERAQAEKRPSGVGYGPLFPTADQTTGLPLLHLPEGFSYVSLGWTGDLMANGLRTPSAHDGMAAFKYQGHRIRLVRNHEQGNGTPFSGAYYDGGASGGTTTLVFDTKEGALIESSDSLSGTIRNCAGGPTPWDSWMTCEETTVFVGQAHGYVFDVPSEGFSDATPIREMGRFSHEALAVDPLSGFIYQTEDAGNSSGLYRYVPNKKHKPAEGGELSMLKVQRQSLANLGAGFPNGATFDVEWVSIDTPDNQSPTMPGNFVWAQGRAKNAATFARLEGCWYGKDKRIYIVSTSGGAVGQGQIWVYDPKEETISLLFESPSPAVLNAPDNITVSPRGGLVLCEDGGGEEFLHGLTVDGEIFQFAKNSVVLSGERNGITGNFAGSEFAGACYSPDGDWLFANIQSPGITVAITGPWQNGAL
jgi:secreted PhoX family phosphatase